MPTPIRRRLRLARRSLGYAVAISLVLMALAAGVVSQLLPLAERHPDEVAAWLSARVQRPVHFDRLQTQWTRRGPLLRLEGLRIGDGAQALQIGAAEILVSQYAGLLPGRSFTELRLRGLDLTLERQDDGRWQVRGLPGEQQTQGDPFEQLEGLGELQVIGGKLRVLAPALQIDARVPKIDVRLRVDGDRVRIGARAFMRPDGAPVDARVDFQRTPGDGRGYVSARKVDLDAWSPLLHVAGVAVDGGNGNVQAWAQLHDHRIQSLTVDAALQRVHLRGAALADARAGESPQIGFDDLRLRARWQAEAGGWRLDAPRLRIGHNGQAQVLDGLLVAGGQRYALVAKRIDAGPLFAVAALSDRLLPGLRRWLVDSTPDAVLHDVQVAGRRGGTLQAHARIEDLRFASHGDAPGISGLSGTLDGDADGIAFDFDPKATFRFDWPRGFGPVHAVQLRGRVAGWREGAGWQVATPALRVDGIGYGAEVRGGMTFQGDGTLPYIDLAVQLDPAQVPIARRFWVRHMMSPGTVHWLDTALLGGRVLDGRALVSGDLDDWPFAAHDGGDRNGIFEADARLEDAVVKFSPEWPAADHVNGDVSFIADGFTVKGRGEIAGVKLPTLEAGIPQFSKAVLDVQAKASADAGQLLALIKRSPLYKPQAETLDNLRASGPASTTFAMQLPLHVDGTPVPTIDGSVVLSGAKLSETRWKLDFSDVRGAAKYDHDGFDANDLRAIHDGQPGRLALRAGPGHVRDKSQAFEAELSATLDAGALLDRASEMAWLKPYAQGRSPWTIAVNIANSASTTSAKSTADAPVRLRLQSNLVGTALTLPAPLDKPAPASLATSIDTLLPLGAGELNVAFGQRMALRAHSGNGTTGIRVVLGSDHVNAPPPASGLVAEGRATRLDAIDWAALAMGGSGDASLPLRSVDITADKLQLLGTSFANTRVRAQPAVGGATSVRIDGAALAGALSLPKGQGAPVVGDFARVHWGAITPLPDAQAGSAGPTQAAGDDLDPGKIPPLQLTIVDLRVGQAKLGRAELRTRAVANGLHVERLQTRAPGQQIDASGDWLGKGAQARSHLLMDLRSDDFGKLIDGFGFGGQLARGHGQAHLDAGWPGSPADFKAANLDGSLSLAVKDGQLVEVEPGAGRVLGLLSIAQLPRRLTLDFRDFFSKGFAFNSLGGTLRFAGGQARSDDMQIDGPAAQIHIKGSADLRAETFDQTIEVLPKSGNLLTVAGAIAGGPVGAAVGAVANAVLRKPLGELGAKTYRVSGPWKEPKVDVISRAEAAREDAPPPATPPAPPR